LINFFLVPVLVPILSKLSKIIVPVLEPELKIKSAHTGIILVPVLKTGTTLHHSTPVSISQ